MRWHLLVPVLFLCCPFSAWAQTGSGHGKSPTGASSSASPPASASSPAANTGNQQNGYVYRLPRNYHIKYASKKSSTHFIPRDTVTASNVVINSKIADKTIISCDTIVGYISPVKQQIQKRGHSPCDVYSRKTIPVDMPADTVCGVVCVKPSPFTETDIHYDSLSRYWQSTGSFLKKHRLKVSITQTDSGKLQLGIYDRNFPTLKKPAMQKDIHFAILINGDSVVDDYAIPLSGDDSALNFYLQIDNKVTVSSPLTYYSLPYSLTQYGAMLIPFKYRWAPKNSRIYVKSPQHPADSVVSTPSESTGSFNLAVYVGRKWGWTRFYFDASKTKNTLSLMAAGFVGASVVPLSMSNVAYPKYIDSLPAQTIAFTFGGSLTVEWRGIDLGLFGGADYTSKSLGWVYNRKFWLGFGIGVNLGMFTSGPTQLQL